jgi:hypothetical protein
MIRQARKRYFAAPFCRGAGQESWSAGLQPAFSGIFGGKPSATRRSDSSALLSDFFVPHPFCRAILPRANC